MNGDLEASIAFDAAWEHEQDDQDETPAELTYRRELLAAQDALDSLLFDHGDACECDECERAWHRLMGIESNPPCPFCRGQGCGQCQYTGVR